MIECIDKTQDMNWHVSDCFKAHCKEPGKFFIGQIIKTNWNSETAGNLNKNEFTYVPLYDNLDKNDRDAYYYFIVDTNPNSLMDQLKTYHPKKVDVEIEIKRHY